MILKCDGISPGDAGRNFQDFPPGFPRLAVCFFPFYFRFFIVLQLCWKLSCRSKDRKMFSEAAQAFRNGTVPLWLTAHVAQFCADSSLQHVPLLQLRTCARQLFFRTQFSVFLDPTVLEFFSYPSWGDTDVLGSLF